MSIAGGRLPRPASKVRWNAGLVMTEPFLQPKERNLIEVSNYIDILKHQIKYGIIYANQMGDIKCQQMVTYYAEQAGERSYELSIARQQIHFRVIMEISDGA
jgi:hypothetical protein